MEVKLCKNVSYCVHQALHRPFRRNNYVSNVSKLAPLSKFPIFDLVLKEEKIKNFKYNSKIQISLIFSWNLTQLDPLLKYFQLVSQYFVYFLKKSELTFLLTTETQILSSVKFDWVWTIQNTASTTIFFVNIQCSDGHIFKTLHPRKQSPEQKFLKLYLLTERQCERNYSFNSCPFEGQERRILWCFINIFIKNIVLFKHISYFQIKV